ncbi:MAG: hypothetical protein V3T23_11375 [Nitrososphaerales archaeon]
MTEATEATTTNPYVVDKEEFEKEGLTPAAPYNWNFISMSEGTKAVYKDGEATGESYPVINGVLEAVEVAEYDEEGNFDGTRELDPVMTRRETFKLSGTGAKKLRTAYRAVTGRALSGQPVQEEDENGNPVTRYRVDLLGAAEELLGGSAWNNIFHTESTAKFASRDLLTNTFKQKPPQRIRVAKPADDEE